MADFPSPQPHDPVHALTDRLYVVHGAMRINAALRISRNMVGLATIMQHSLLLKTKIMRHFLCNQLQFL